MRLRSFAPTRTNNRTYKFVSVLNIPKHIIASHLLCFLLLVAICSSNEVNYLPIGALGESTESDATRMTIGLPQGFHPQEPPIKPMLLPFVTPAPNSPSGGWKPIVGTTAMPPPSIAMPPPTTQKRMDTVSRELNIDQEEGPLLEAIVYGTWKPERPLKPNEIGIPTSRPITTTTAVYSSVPPTTSMEYLGKQHPITIVETVATKLNQKNGRKRITTTRTDPSTASPPTHIVVKMSDPHLLEVAKQINDSLGEILTHANILKNQSLQQPTTEISLEAESETQAEMEELPMDVSRMWPTDFTDSLERDNKHKLTQQNSNHSFVDISNSLLPQLPAFNITKLGVPYEKQNTAEESMICVPLFVLEELSQGQLVEIERVYCFPLPPSHKQTPKMKDVPAKVDNYTEYEAVNVAPKLSSNYIRILILSLTSLNFLKIKYS